MQHRWHATITIVVDEPESYRLSQAIGTPTTVVLNDNGRRVAQQVLMVTCVRCGELRTAGSAPTHCTDPAA